MGYDFLGVPSPLKMKIKHTLSIVIRTNDHSPGKQNEPTFFKNEVKLYFLKSSIINSL